MRDSYTPRMPERLLGWVAQRALDGLISSGDRQRWRRKLLEAARSMLVAWEDPAVTYDLAGAPLLVPLSHDLPLIRKVHPGYLTNLAAVATHVAHKYPRGCNVDVGANVGDTAVVIRSVTDTPILCIEGDPLFARILRSNMSPLTAISIEESFVGPKAETRSVAVERARGTARLVEHESTLIRFSSLSEIFNRHSLFSRPTLLKIDVDGWDTAILAAEAELLADVRPVVFFEFDPQASEAAGFEAPAVFPVLRDAGYSYMAVYSNTGTYLTAVSLHDADRLDELENLSRAGAVAYCDIAAFHRQDTDLFEAARMTALQRGRAADT